MNRTRVLQLQAKALFKDSLIRDFFLGRFFMETRATASVLLTQKLVWSGANIDFALNERPDVYEDAEQFGKQKN